MVAGLVVVCLVLFTGYFRESDGGPLHGVQDGVGAAVAPVQSVATDAVQPFRDAWDWFADLRGARERAATLERENAALLAQVIDERAQAEELERLRGLAGVGAGLDADYRRVTARIDGRSVTAWSRSARIDAGSDDGLVVNSPVLALGTDGEGPVGALVGVVTTTSAHSSVVSFITDGRTEVGATVQQAGSPTGLLRSLTPGQLSLSNVPRDFDIREGQVVVTAGFSALGLRSVYPPDLPVGQVTGVGRREVDVEQTVQVTPFVDSRRLRYLIVLAPTSERARRRATG